MYFFVSRSSLSPICLACGTGCVWTFCCLMVLMGGKVGESQGHWSGTSLSHVEYHCLFVLVYFFLCIPVEVVSEQLP
ncbi:hypothetical protein BDW68DRAFT_172097 [Aspergillus falconensis]